MAASRLDRACLPGLRNLSTPLPRRPHHNLWVSRGIVHRSRLPSHRSFTSSTARLEQRQHRKESFSSRLKAALAKTKIQWYPIPVGLGIGFLGVAQFYRVQQREKARVEEEEYERSLSDGGPEDEEPGPGRPKKRKRVRPSGPWQIQIMSTLPLKAMSRLWGKFNEMQIPYYLRIPGFKLYSWIFGVNLSEVAEPDLHVYPNLASFFYRELKPGVRPLDPNPNALLSPADGKVIQFGTIERSGELEQVKGVTYSLEGLLGSKSPSVKPTASPPATPQPSDTRTRTGDAENISADEEFAQLNGISYSIPNLFSGPVDSHGNPQQYSSTDQSTTSHKASESEVSAELQQYQKNPSSSDKPWWSPSSSNASEPTTLYYIVVYLAPGDYHRFHSPASWVVTARRHFAGELYSVSPYLQRTLPGLFTLNERVVLLGRWRWGFFSYTPVGATNVGSIVVNFDRELRTNSLTTDTAADRAAEQAQKRGEPYSGFAEATYDGASAVLGGHALRRGQEMGGFKLGSTIVMVFEGPKGRRKSLDEGHTGERVGGWKWCVDKGDKVKVGQALGMVDE